MKHKRQGQGGSKNCDENGSKSSSCGNEDEDSLDGLQGKDSQSRRTAKCESGGGARLRPETRGSGPGSCGNDDEDSGTDETSDPKGGHVDEGRDHDLDKLLPSPEDMDPGLSCKEDQERAPVGPSLSTMQRVQPQTPPSLSLLPPASAATAAVGPEPRIPPLDAASKFYSRSPAFAATAPTSQRTFSAAPDFPCPYSQPSRDYDHSPSYGGAYFSNESQTYASGYVGASACSTGSGASSPFQSSSVAVGVAAGFCLSSSTQYYDSSDVQSRENLTPNVETEYNSYCGSYGSSHDGSSSSGGGVGGSVQSQRSYYDNYNCQYRDGQSGGGGSGSFSRSATYGGDVYPDTHTHGYSGYQQQQQQQPQGDHSLSHFSNQSSSASVPTNQSPIIDPYVQSNNYFEMISAVNY